MRLESKRERGNSMLEFAVVSEFLVPLRVWNLRIWKNMRGRDLTDYAIMVAFLAVAAGAVVPGVATSIITIFSSIVNSK